MKLSTEQLKKIQTFIQKRGIVYEDVQAEVLDHVATAVEERMAADEALSFEEALHQTHLSFGVFGFSTIEDATMSGLSKKFFKLFLNYLKAFFGIRYIGLLFIGIFFLYTGVQMLRTMEGVMMVFLWMVIVFYALLIVLAYRLKRFNKLLTYRISVTYLVQLGPFLTFFGLMSHHKIILSLSSTSYSLLLTGALACLLLYLIAAFRTAVKGLKESLILKEKYQRLSN